MRGKEQDLQQQKIKEQTAKAQAVIERTAKAQAAKEQTAKEQDSEEIVCLDKIKISLKEREKRFCAVHGVSFSLFRGRTLGIIGESGCGKTLLCHALLDLLEKDKWEVEGRVCWNPGFSVRDVGMIVQNPASAFDPRMKLSGHFREMAGVLGLSRRKITEEALSLLYRTGIRDPKRVLDSYAFALSGGMLQRVMISLALLGKPKLLIADEPTTALDITTQWEILELLGELKQEYGISILLVSHDLKVIQSMAEDICVMYAGYVVEQGPAEEVLTAPLHPYTRGLLASRPSYSKTQIQAMEGCPPGIRDWILGCPFAPRCGYTRETCHKDCPPLCNCGKENTGKVHRVRCFLAGKGERT